MLSITLADLWFRRRQFGLAIVAVAIVFAVALSLTGMTDGFYAEARATASSLGADAWVVPAAKEGPFTSVDLVDERLAAAVAKEPGVRRAQPVTTLQASVMVGRKSGTVMVMGYPVGGVRGPRVTRGRSVLHAGEAVADTILSAKVGQTISFGSAAFRVVGLVHGDSVFGGMPVVYLGLHDAQEVGFGGAPEASAFVTQGVPARLPPGLHLLTIPQLRHSLLAPMSSAVSSIANSRTLMWIVAAAIIGIVVYLAALERFRDMAVLKAIGATGRGLAAGTALQAVVTSVLASLLAIALSEPFRLLFSLPVVITTEAYLFTPAVAFLVGLLASVAAIRRTLRVDPALAFGG